MNIDVVRMTFNTLSGLEEELTEAVPFETIEQLMDFLEDSPYSIFMSGHKTFGKSAIFLCASHMQAVALYTLMASIDEVSKQCPVEQNDA